MLAHFEEYTDVVGDHPINLAATTLAANAFMATGNEKYRNWLLEYVDAWKQRALDNDGILPSNIGLDGKIGGETEGKWYGGCYGWGFTVTVPQTGELANRNSIYRGIAGFGNALLLTGDQSYVDVWRKMLDAVNSNKKTVDGTTLYPHMFGDEGWYGYDESPYNEGALDIYRPAGELCREAGVLAFSANRERELAVRNDDGRVLLVSVQYHLVDLGRTQGAGDQNGRVITPLDDVNFFAHQLVDDVLEANTPQADAGANRVDTFLVGRDGDFAARAGLPGDGLDLDYAIEYFGHFCFE